MPGGFDVDLVSKLHVFRAFIKELLRISSVVPLGLPHRCREDVVVGTDGGNEYVIQRGDLVHINSWMAHKYQDWSGGGDGDGYRRRECNEVHLEYWLDPETLRFVDNKRLLAFDRGKRDCIGRRVAEKALQCIFGLFMLRFRFEAIEDIGDIQQKWSTVQVVDPPVPLRLHKRE